MENAQWFESWFDSKYYHLLYKDRDYEEAANFMKALLAYLKPQKSAAVLDLACGKGRHAVFLAGKGLDVTGIDLSKKSIAHASRYETNNLSFFVHDMRQAFRINYFDYVFNLFTSFGYFEDDGAHLQTLENVAKSLKQNGVFVLDFFNSKVILKDLVKFENKEVDDIYFAINRSVKENHIVKQINFEADSLIHSYEERVRAFSKEELEGMIEKAGMKVKAVFGDYKLNPFDADTSPRLILIAEKC